MPIFISQGRFSQSAMKGMVARPEDRAEEVTKLVERAGGKLLGYYVTFGEHDFLVIIDMPGTRETAAAVIAAAAGGGVADMTTVPAMTSAEAKQVFADAAKLAQSFRPAGGS